MKKTVRISYLNLKAEPCQPLRIKLHISDRLTLTCGACAKDWQIWFDKEVITGFVDSLCPHCLQPNYWDNKILIQAYEEISKAKQ
jgi:hypothetical protein